MNTDVEIVIAVISSVTAIILAIINRLQSKKSAAQTAENELQYRAEIDLIKAKAKSEEEKMKVTVALLEKQANDNKQRIEIDLRFLHDFIHSHTDEHKALDAKFESFNKITEVLVILTEQNKTLFKNQEKTETKVEKIDEKIDVLKDAVLKGSK